MARGGGIGAVYVTVEANTRKFLVESKAAGARGGDAAGREWAKRFEAQAEDADAGHLWIKLDAEAAKHGDQAGKNYSSGFGRGASSRMKLIIGAIVALAEPATASLGGLGGAAVALAGSLVQAGGAAGALAPIFGAAAASVGVLVLAFSNFTKSTVPAVKELRGALKELQDPFDDLRETVQEHLFAGMADEITDLATVLLPQLDSGLGHVADALNNTFGGVADVLKGFDFGLLLDWFATIIDTAGPGVADVLQGVLDFLQAAAPAATILAASFSETAGKFADWVGQNPDAINDFLVNGIEQAGKWLDVLEPLSNALFDILNAGSDSGQSLLENMAGLAEQLAAWTGSAEGQQAMQEFFDLAISAFTALAPALEGLVEGLGNLFTPDAVSNLAALSSSLGVVLPVIGDLLALVGRSGILVAAGKALEVIADVLVQSGIIDLLGELADIIAATLMRAIEDLIPVLATWGPLFADMLAEIIPMLPSLIDSLLELAEMAIPIIIELMPVLANLFMEFVPTLQAVVDMLESLMPVIEIWATLLDWAVRFGVIPLINAISLLVTWSSALWTSIAQTFGEMNAAMTGAWTAIPGVIGSIADTMANLITGPLAALGGAFSALGQLIIDALNIALGSVTNFTTNLQTMFTLAVEAVGSVFSSVFGSIQAVIQPVVDFILSMIDRVIGAAEHAKDVLGTIGDVVSAPGRALGGLVGAIPGLASGGLVTEPMRTWVGEAGPEAVIPLARPLSQVDPAVRGMAAMLRGQPTGTLTSVPAGRTVNAVYNVYPQQADPESVALAMMNRATLLAAL